VRGAGALVRRVADLERRWLGRARYVVEVPLEHLVRDVPGSEEVRARAIAEHRRRTGWDGPVMLAPERAATAEEWLARYSPRP